MGPILYIQDFSTRCPPVRSVLLTAEALGLALEKKIIDLSKKEHLTDNYLKLNPHNTIPVLDDNGVIIWESHAINAYLVGKYGNDDSLYPKDLGKRALVDQMLHFDTGVIFTWLKYIATGHKYKGRTVFSEDQTEALEEAYQHLDVLLKGNQWVTGDSITIADFNLLTSMTSANLIYPVDPQKYPNIVDWLQRAESLPYYNVNREGLQSFKTVFKGLIQNANLY